MAAKNRLQIYRRISQGIGLLIAIGIGIAFSLGLIASFDAICAMGGIELISTFLTSGTVLRYTSIINLVLLGLVLISGVLFGRVFCGWFCPLGTVQGWISRFLRRITGGRKHWLPIHLPRWLDRPMRWVKWLVLGWVVYASITAVVPPLMAFCPYRTLFTMNVGSALGAGVVVVFLIWSIAIERFWCRYACPLGAVLSVTNLFSRWRIKADETSCVSCGRCEAICPMDIDPSTEVERSMECIRCMECTGACPREGTLCCR